MSIKNIVLASVFTGVSVTAGIYGLQEYRQYQAEVEFAEAEAARKLAKEEERIAEIKHMHACIDRVVNDLYEEGRTDDFTVELMVELSCPGAYGFMGVSRMKDLVEKNS